MKQHLPLIIILVFILLVYQGLIDVLQKENAHKIELKALENESLKLQNETQKLNIQECEWCQKSNGNLAKTPSQTEL